MIIIKHFFSGATLLFAALFLFVRCSDDEGTNPDLQGTAQIEITDAPVDDPNVKGVFVTVTAVKVDGNEITGFSKQTIDLMAYQNGNTKTLGALQLEQGTHSDVELVLDLEADADGIAPGCYVLTNDNVKHNLKASSGTEVKIEAQTGNFEVTKDSTTNVVLDFDLHKSVRYEDDPQSGDQYDFVTNNELKASLRVVSKANAATITGNVQDNLNLAGDKIVVYVYEKGEFNKNTEMSGQGDSNVQFKNAVSSAVVGTNGNYTLSFLEEGDYELHLFGYEDSDNDGKLEIKGELDLEILGGLGIDLNNISLDAKGSVAISLLVLGILP